MAHSRNYAVSFWLKDVDATNAVGTIFNAMSGSGIDSGFQVKVTGGRLQWIQTYTGSNGSHFVNIPATTVNNFSSSYLNSSSPQGESTGGESNGWHHIVFNIDRQESASAYVNGVFVAGSDISVSASADIGPELEGDYPKPIIGASDTNNTGLPFDHLTGSLDEFRIYKKKLSLDEITDLYINGGTYVTQSSAVTLATPKEDLTTQVWRRIVNNLPHLLKTKGTSRSVKALLACYGIPESLLSIREYGGPKMPETTPAAIEDRFSYALQVERGSFIRFGNARVSSSISGVDPSGTPFSWGRTLDPLPNSSAGAGMPIITRELRFKPAVKETQFIWATVDSNISFARMNQSLIIEHTASYSGSDEYGRIRWTVGQAGSVTSEVWALKAQRGTSRLSVPQSPGHPLVILWSSSGLILGPEPRPSNQHWAPHPHP